MELVAHLLCCIASNLDNSAFVLKCCYIPKRPIIFMSTSIKPCDTRGMSMVWLVTESLIFFCCRVQLINESVGNKWVYNHVVSPFKRCRQGSICMNEINKWFLSKWKRDLHNFSGLQVFTAYPSMHILRVQNQEYSTEILFYSMLTGKIYLNP